MDVDRSTDDQDRAGTPRAEAAVAFAVGVGGAIGASARWVVATLVDGDAVDDGGFPFATLAVNLIGCLGIGLLAARLTTTSRARAFLVTGVLGGFTTMSAVAVELNGLADADRQLAAASYLALTLGAGVAAVLVGERISRPRSSLDPRRASTR